MGGASNAFVAGLTGNNTIIEQGLEVARDAIDAKTMRDLRADLDCMMERVSARVLTRDRAVALLQAMSDGLKPSTDIFVGRIDEGTVLVKNHPAVELLDELIDALADLDNGKTHAALKRASYAPNASLTTMERKWDDAVLEAVLVVQRARGFKTRAQAEEFLAGKLKAAGKKRRNKPYSAKMLKTLRDDRLKRKSSLKRQK